MAKYDPLRDYLQQQTSPEFSLTLSEIEGVLGAPLPKGALRPEWWADIGPDRSGDQRFAWLAAGYEAAMRGGNRVLFKKVK